jgi:glycosyltransferase involved in cell wall biosynthesis
MHFAKNIRRKGHLPKHIVTMHGMYELDNEDTAKHLPVLIKNVDHWVYTADKNLGPFKQLGLYRDGRFVKIGLGMNFAKINPVQRSLLKIAADAFVVCVASRAISEKGWEESIAAVELSRKKTGRDIHLVLVGNGPAYQSLSKRAIPPHLHLLGFKLNPVDYYAMADLGLMTSTYRAESFPMSIVECLMAGRPVVASDIGEIRNMLTLSNGRIAGSVFSIVDGKIPVEAASDAINACVSNRDLYEQLSAYAREAANKFDISHVVELYAGLYGKVLGRTKK